MAKVRLKVKGMSCEGCAKSVQDALLKVKGVEEAKVDLCSSTAEVTFDSCAVSVDKIICAVKEAGYEAEEIKGCC